jgi:hypothetical protein
MERRRCGRITCRGTSCSRFSLPSPFPWEQLHAANCKLNEKDWFYHIPFRFISFMTRMNCLQQQIFLQQRIWKFRISETGAGQNFLGSRIFQNANSEFCCREFSCRKLLLSSPLLSSPPPPKKRKGLGNSSLDLVNNGCSCSRLCSNFACSSDHRISCSNQLF